MSNSDVYTTSRIIIFQWFPSTAITLAPGVGDILQNPSGAVCFSQYNFELSENYRVLEDLIFHQSGATGFPTSTSSVGKFNHSVSGLFSDPSKLDIEFALGTNEGINKVFILCISDTAVTPYPILNWTSRIFYTDTLRM